MTLCLSEPVSISKINSDCDPSIIKELEKVAETKGLVDFQYMKKISGKAKKSNYKPKTGAGVRIGFLMELNEVSG